MKLQIFFLHPPLPKASGMIKRVIKKSEVKKTQTCIFFQNKLAALDFYFEVIFFKLRIYGVANPGMILTSWQKAVLYVVWNLGLCLSSFPWKHQNQAALGAQIMPDFTLRVFR